MVLVDVLLVAGLVGSYAFLNSFLLLVCGLPLLLGFNYLYLRQKMSRLRPVTALRKGEPAGGAVSLYTMSVVFFGGAAYGVYLFSTGELPLALVPVLVVPVGFGLYLLRQARKVGARPAE
jgi:hypothetical protein